MNSIIEPVSEIELKSQQNRLLLSRASVEVVIFGFVFRLQKLFEQIIAEGEWKRAVQIHKVTVELVYALVHVWVDVGLVEVFCHLARVVEGNGVFKQQLLLDFAHELVNLWCVRRVGNQVFSKLFRQRKQLMWSERVVQLFVHLVLHQVAYDQGQDWWDDKQQYDYRNV